MNLCDQSLQLIFAPAQLFRVFKVDRLQIILVAKKYIYIYVTRKKAVTAVAAVRRRARDEL